MKAKDTSDCKFLVLCLVCKSKVECLNKGIKEGEGCCNKNSWEWSWCPQPYRNHCKFKEYKEVIKPE